MLYSKPSLTLMIQNVKLDTITDILEPMWHHSRPWAALLPHPRPCSHPHSPWRSRTFTLVLLWIPLSAAATHTVNKMHCIFAALSSPSAGTPRCLAWKEGTMRTMFSGADIPKGQQRPLKTLLEEDTLRTAVIRVSNSLSSHSGSLGYKYSTT